MNKAILIIDMPDSCKECPCGTAQETMTFDEYCCCEVLDKQIDEGEYSLNVPQWRPLKEIPKKYELVSTNFEIGWNGCVNEILKEDESG